MKLEIKDSPRKFQPRKDRDIIISDLGNVMLEPNEQLTFVNSEGMCHDFAAKDWGFYATPSINGRLKNEGFKTALVRNEFHQIYVMVVNPAKLELFQKYCVEEDQEILEWLDERPLKK